MRAWEIHEQFGLESLRLQERTALEPGHGQVVVRVRAASLNYRDLLMTMGLYNPRQPLPLVPGSDGAGEIIRIGEGVTGFAEGDRVMGAFMQSWLRPPVPRRKEDLLTTLGGPLDGVFTEEVLYEADALVSVPDDYSFNEASTLPCAALTAWSALITQGKLRPDDTLLIQGTGGVALFALSIAKMVGARVIITSSSDEKLTKARALGADETINYSETKDWGRVARKMTDGGVDHVLELGGAGTLEQTLRAVRPGAQVSLIGVLAGPVANLNITPILMQNVRVQGILVGSRDELARMTEAFARHQIKPTIDKTFAFDKLPEAFKHMQAGRHFGKIVLEGSPD